MTTPLQVLLCIAVLISAAKLAGSITARLGLPLVLGELLAGVLLGPSCLNLWNLPWLGSASTCATIFKALAGIGVVLLMFVAGLETDLNMMRRAVGPAFSAAAGGVVLPLAGGFWLARRFGFGALEAVFIGTILTATSVTITAQTLINLKRLQSKAGSTILSAAVIDDVLGLIVLSVVIALAPRIGSTGTGAWQGIAVTLGRMAVCLVLILWLGPRLTRWALQQAARLHGNHTEVTAALVLALVFAFLAEWMGGMAVITGAYLAGLFVAGSSSKETVARELQPMVSSFFGPLFFVSVGLAVNAWDIGGRLGLFVALLALAILGKVIGSGLGAYLGRCSARDAGIVGIGMIPRGEVGLITASLGLAAGLVARDVYVQVVVLVLITTLITPALLKLAFETARGGDARAVESALSPLPPPIAEAADL